MRWPRNWKNTTRVSSGPDLPGLGLDPDALPARDGSSMDYASGSTRPKAWKDVVSAGQRVGLVADIPSVGELVAQLAAQYQRATARHVGRVPALST